MTVYDITVLIATATGLALGLVLFAVGCVCWLFGRPFTGARRKHHRRG